MKDLRQIGLTACVILVVLRLSIGWQVLYEGLWKLDTQDTSQPWTAAGYLRNAQGPFRDYFRSMTGDPDDLHWLDYDAVAARWDWWHAKFAAHHTDMTDQQRSQLHRMLNGARNFTVSLVELPEGVSLDRFSRIVKWDAKNRRLVVDGEWHMTPRERDQILALADPVEHPEFHQAVNRLYDIQSRLSYKERLAALVKGDPERAGFTLTGKQNEVLETRKGEIAVYRELLSRYDENVRRAKQSFQYDHLNKQWSEIQGLRSKLVGPVKALDAELQQQARELLTPAQWARGPVPPIRDRLWQIDQMTMWGLVVLGALLIFGLATRVAAAGAAVMIFSFYLAMPPWPGALEFQPTAGPEHSYIVNKNLIEVIALLAIAALPTGAWFGVDRLFYGWIARRRAARGNTAVQRAPTAARQPPSKSAASTPVPGKT